jgi:curved DNA-binding protein CbpA
MGGVAAPSPPGAMGRGITWYDILGVLPSVSADKIRREYDAKTSLLRPELISGAPSTVVKAASRAQGLLDAAQRVLGDPVNRELYDEEAGFRRSGEGLADQAGVPSDPGWGPADFNFAAGRAAAGLLGALTAISDWLAPHPRPPRRVPVPDVRGLFYSVCLEVAGRLGLQVTAIRLTDRPTPVDGLVVDQFPLPPAMVRRAGTLTVRVWHPPARSAGQRPT